MLLVISPAKNLDFETPAPTKQMSKADLLSESAVLINELRELAPQDVSQLMKISDKLGVLNYDRFQSWKQPFKAPKAKQAVLAFNGDVYAGLGASEFTETEFLFMQQHLRILSGLYGLLRPMDLMLPYRLEMGTRFSNSRGKNLYEFWGDKITTILNVQLNALGSQELINLASNEYFKSVQPKLLKAKVITPVFKDKKGDQYKVISFYAKKARGLMCQYVIKNRITKAEKLKGFDLGGYEYSEAMSVDDEWVFIRDEVKPVKTK
jgi:cytoplasmic iron level regulating protein YaaA (DUF328/UPF0246 family)